MTLLPRVELARTIATCVFGGCEQPLCTDDDPLPSGTVTNVRVELHGPTRAGHPVFLQDATGEMVVEGTTDADGVFILDSAPADGALTVELPDGEDGLRLYTYLGLVSDDVLEIEVERPRRSRETLATVTVMFDQLDDPAVDHYSIDLGANCGNSGPIAHDPSNPTRSHTVEVEAGCIGEPGRAVGEAVDAAGQYLAAAGVALDLAPNDAVSVVLPPWETDTETITFAGNFLGDTYGSVSATWDGTIVNTAQVHYGGGGAYRLPSAPSAFNGVRFALAGGPEVQYRGYLSPLVGFTVDLAAFPAPIAELRATDLQSGAPHVSWRHEGDREAIATVAMFGASETDIDLRQIVRYVIRGGSHCHIDMPTLPARYVPFVPTVDRRLFAGVRLIFADGVDADTARRRIGPGVHEPANLSYFTAEDGISTSNYFSGGP